MEHHGETQLEVITRQIKELVGIYRGAVSQSGVSENEFWVWYALIVMGGKYSQQDICGMWSLPKQTINTIIMYMVQKGFVSLEVVPGTRNRKTICLTKAGREYGERIVLPVSEAEQRAIERLPPEDLVACTAALGRYINILKEETYATEAN